MRLRIVSSVFIVTLPPLIASIEKSRVEERDLPHLHYEMCLEHFSLPSYTVMTTSTHTISVVTHFQDRGLDD